MQAKKSVEPKRAPEPKKSNPAPADPTAGQANFPGQPKGEFDAKLPSRLDSDPVAEPRAQIRRGETDAPGIQARVEKREMDESVDNLAHRQALQSLLKKMKEEFGLDAEQVVEAFAALTPQELAQPPEQSLDRLIQSLPLNPEQQEQAKLYFQQMLKNTAETDMAGYLKSSQRQLSLEVVSQKEARDRAIQRAVEQMQSDFFTQPQAQAQQVQAPSIAADKYKSQQGKAVAGENTGNIAVPFMANPMPVRSPGDGALAAGPMSPRPGQALMPTMDQQAQFFGGTNSAVPVAPEMKINVTENAPQAGLASPMLEDSAAAESAPAVEVPDFYDMQMDSAPMPLDIPESATVKITSGAESAAALSPAPTESAVVGSMTAMGQGAGNTTDDDRRGEDSAESWNPPVNQAVSRQNQPLAAQKPESFMVNTQPTPTQEAQNIKEVVSKAQFLAAKGGGEMKITMTPEGMGEVTMKVAIQGGNVNVEMIAASKETKKLLEHGLGDLKATLLANNLKVDQIKVDSSSDISRQLTQNHDEAQRQFAQQFMEQFRQENNQWRQGFYDIAGARTYRGQKEEAERGPTINTDSDRRRNSSRRLDLVA